MISSSSSPSSSSRIFLLEHFARLGTVQTTLLLMAVWWVWIYTIWVTNWLDPDKTPLRLMLFALMLAGLVLSTSIPKAFEGRGLTFRAGLYLHGAQSHAFHHARAQGRQSRKLPKKLSAHHGMAHDFRGVLGRRWLAEHDVRLVLWTVAIAIEYVSPAGGFFVPRLGRAATRSCRDEHGYLPWSGDRPSMSPAISCSSRPAVFSHRIKTACPRAPVVTPLLLSLASAVALIVVAAWETRFSPRDHAEA